MHVHTYMARKTISITLEAYDRLRARKGRDESFTDVILRLTGRRSLADVAGMLSKASVKAIRDAIDEARHRRRALDGDRRRSDRGHGGGSRANLARHGSEIPRTLKGDSR